MKIATILPYKENYTLSKAQAAAIWVCDFFKFSKYKDTNYIFGNTNTKDYLTKNYPETLQDKCIFYDGSQDGGDDCKLHFNKKGYLLMINFISELINKYPIRTF